MPSLKNPTEFLVTVLALALIARAPDPYEQQWQLVAGLVILGLAWLLRRAVSFPLLALGAYLWFRVLYTVSGNDGLPVPQWLAFVSMGLRQTAFLTGAIVLGRFIGPTRVFDWAVPLAALSTIFGYPLLPFNDSMNACLLVVTLPMVSRSYQVILMILVGIVVVFIQGGAMAIILLNVWVVLEFYRRDKWFAIGFGASAALGAVILFACRFQESTRYAFYAASFRYWWNHVDFWFGSGLGSFIGLGPVIQKGAGIMMDDPKQVWWLSMHSDWLQLGFELGVVGLALGIALVVCAFIESDRETRIALLLLTICAGGYFPMQVPVFVVYAAWLIARSQFKGVECRLT